MVTEAEYEHAFEVKETILKDNQGRLDQIATARLDLSKKLAKKEVGREDFIQRMNMLAMEERAIRKANFLLVQEWLKVDMQYQSEHSTLQAKTTEELIKNGVKIDTWRLET